MKRGFVRKEFSQQQLEQPRIFVNILETNLWQSCVYQQTERFTRAPSFMTPQRSCCDNWSCLLSELQKPPLSNTTLFTVHCPSQTPASTFLLFAFCICNWPLCQHIQTTHWKLFYPNPLEFLDEASGVQCFHRAV